MKLIKVIMVMMMAFGFSHLSTAAVNSAEMQSFDNMLVHFEETEVAEAEACEGEACPEEATSAE